MNREEAFEILGIRSESSHSEVEIAYNSLVSDLQKQIDRSPSRLIKESLTKSLDLINSAHNFLKLHYLNTLRQNTVLVTAELRTALDNLELNEESTVSEAKDNYEKLKNEYETGLKHPNPKVREISENDLKTLDFNFNLVIEYLEAKQEAVKQQNEVKQKLTNEISDSIKQEFYRKIYDFNLIVEQGLEQFKNKNFAQASNYFKDALRLFPDDASINFLLKQCTELPKISEENEKKREFEFSQKFSQARKKFDDEQLANKIQYKSLVKSAIDNFNNEEFEKCIELFNQAENIFDNTDIHNYFIEISNSQLEKIKKLIKNRTTKRESESTLESFHLTENKREFDSYSNSALIQFKSGNYLIALSLFEKALAIFPNDSNVKFLIEQCRQNLRKDNDNAESTADTQNTRSPDDDIHNFSFIAKQKEVTNLLSKKDYEAALEKLSEMRSDFPGNRDIEYQIKEIEDILKEDNSGIEQNSVGNSNLVKADRLFEENNYREALIFYTYAKQENQGNQYIEDQIYTCNFLINQELKEKKKSQEKLQINSQIESENKIIELRNQADIFFNQGNFEEAIKYYNKVLELKPGDVYCQICVQECEKHLNEITDEDFSPSVYEQDFSSQPQKAATLFENNGDFHSLVILADDLFNKQRYHEALDIYKKALTLNPDDPYVQVLINECSNFIETK